MPNFNRDALKRGAEAIRELNERPAGSNFTPFLPSIYWKDDGDEHFLLILNTIDDIPRVEFHTFIEVEGDPFPHQIMARTDPSIGERTDPIQAQWKYKPRQTNLCVAVELVPTFKMVDGREKPAGFEVQTKTFERRVRDDDGNLTEERETCTAPAIGLITKSPYNFGNQLESYDASEGPIHRTALKIKQLGKGTNVTYQIVGYDGIPVDLSGLIDNIEFVSYLTPDQQTEILDAIEGLDDKDAAVKIGNYILDLKIDEFADPVAYDELLASITRPSRYGEKENARQKPARPARPSQRRTREASEEPVEAPAEVIKSTPREDRVKELRKRMKTTQVTESSEE